MENSLLTPLQKRVLVAFFDNGMGSRKFFFTGGTALAEFYLKHRYSDDLDFFTRKIGLLEDDIATFRQTLSSLNLVISQETMTTEFVRLSVNEEGSKDKLKIEFARDRAGQAMMEEPQVLKGIFVVDSFLDIAVNKVCTILSRGPDEPKDFVDLYFILTSSNYSLNYLVSRAREKEAAFDSEDGVLQFAARLRGVKNPLIMPRMIKPLSHEELSSFLVPLAEQLIRSLAPKQ